MKTIALTLSLLAVGCTNNNTPKDAAPADQKTDDPQLPPQGAAYLQPWLLKGFYKSWHCEAAPHPGRVHGMDRVCDNDVLSTFSGTGEFPVGAAAVKELYTNGAVTGYNVYVKTAAGDCKSFYYFEGGSSGPPSTDQLGSASCVGCHSMAAPPMGHDCAYTIVK